MRARVRVAALARDEVARAAAALARARLCGRALWGVADEAARAHAAVGAREAAAARARADAAAGGGQLAPAERRAVDHAAPRGRALLAATMRVRRAAARAVRVVVVVAVVVLAVVVVVARVVVDAHAATAGARPERPVVQAWRQRRLGSVRVLSVLALALVVHEPLGRRRRGRRRRGAHEA